MCHGSGPCGRTFRVLAPYWSGWLHTRTSVSAWLRPSELTCDTPCTWVAGLSVCLCGSPGAVNSQEAKVAGDVTFDNVQIHGDVKNTKHSGKLKTAVDGFLVVRKKNKQKPAAQGGTGKAVKDLPIGPDLLGIAKLAIAIVLMVCANKEECMCPMNVGLFAPWGTGKSFLMNKIKEQFHKRINEDATYAYRMVEINFNAWIFEGTDNLMPSLINRILEVLENEYTQPIVRAQLSGLDYPHEKRKQRCAHFVALLLFAAFAFLAVAFAVNLFDIQTHILQAVVPFASVLVGAALGYWKLVQPGISALRQPFMSMFGSNTNAKDAKFVAELGMMGAVRDKFKNIVEFLNNENHKCEKRRQKYPTPEPGKRLFYKQADRSIRFVLYVDDLDRVRNGKAVQILEAVKLLLNDTEVPKTPLFPKNKKQEGSVKGLAFKGKRVQIREDVKLYGPF